MRYHIIEKEPCCASQQNWPAKLDLSIRGPLCPRKRASRFRTTPSANPSRTPPSRPRASRCSRTSNCSRETRRPAWRGAPAADTRRDRRYRLRRLARLAGTSAVVVEGLWLVSWGFANPSFRLATTDIAALRLRQVAHHVPWRRVEAARDALQPLTAILRRDRCGGDARGLRPGCPSARA